MDQSAWLADLQGTTFAGRWQGKRVAIKRLAQQASLSPFAPVATVDDLEHEAAILSLLGHHPNIVEFYGLCHGRGGSDDVEVVTRLEEGGSIAAALGIKASCAPPSSRWLSGFGSSVFKPREYDGPTRTRWVGDIARGLANSHSARVVHNDVACRNSLLSEKGANGRALLCDFGISMLLRGGKTRVEAAQLIDVESHNGSAPRWPVRQMPPEALKPPHALSPESDTYMFGTMMYEVSSGVMVRVGSLRPSRADSRVELL